MADLKEVAGNEAIKLISFIVVIVAAALATVYVLGGNVMDVLGLLK